MELLKESLMMILQAVIAVSVPIIATQAIAWFKLKAEQIKTQTDNEKIKWYIDELTNAAATAVAETSQVYVDSIKADGKFDSEHHIAALQKAKTAAINILTPTAKAFLKEAHTDWERLLEAKIEEAVRSQKTNKAA